MLTPIEKLHKWLNTKTLRELVIVSIASLCAIYFLWYQLLANPLWQKQDLLQTNIITAQTVTTKLQTQIHLLNTASNKTTILNIQQEHERLLKQLVLVNQELSPYKQQLIPPNQVLLALKAILNASQKLALVRLENLPVTIINNDQDKTKEVLYEHSFIVELHGDYFSTLQYLQQLEKLPWDIYWDDLNYRVIAYPQADITIKFHILSTEEKLINV